MPFNAAQWAQEHERQDDLRFTELGNKVAGIYKVLGVAGTMLLAVLGWSLKAQYESMDQTMQASRAQLSAIHDLKAEVSKVTD